jgi:hypothetical protein
MALVQVLSLLIYFAATLAFTDSPRRLLLLVRTITIFGFLLAIFGLIQSFVSPTKIYGLRELSGGARRSARLSIAITLRDTWR